ncbi:TRAP transporter small permease subunit [Allosalinactinospora lopnorensis]|uniref:TRAP transporter small permease subunit n=1 Tax=Allosalinactinospora lopnorensis TaxID=1352348 RepID=UPI000623F42E|nr:TRAP transporter small permease [Allosalinactinospora lopnorensis]
MSRSRFLRGIDRLSEAAGHASGLLIIVSMLVVCYGVALRYVFGASTVWQTELSIYLLMFAAFVGGAYGLRHGDHVRITLVVMKLPGRVQLAVRFLAAVLGLVLVATIAVVSGFMWWESVESGARSGTAWNPPLAYPYFIVPLGMALIGLQYLVVAAELFRALIAGEAGGPAPDQPDNSAEGGPGH